MHDLSHEDLAVLLSSGEAPEGTEAAMESCPECRVLLADLRWGSRVAARAAAAPPAALQARVLACAPEPDVAGAVPRSWRRALAFAVVCAVVVALARRDAPQRPGVEDLDGELARVQFELDALAERIGHENSDFDDDIRDLRGDAASLRRQLGG